MNHRWQLIFPKITDALERSMKIIEHTFSPFRYRFDSESFIAEGLPTATAEFVAALEGLDWETILERAAESAASGIAVGVLKILAGPTQWEKRISEDLQNIIGKLDLILDEIRELRKYIRDVNRASIRAALKADLTGPILNLTGYMDGIRKARKLDGEAREMFRRATGDLTQGLSRVVTYQEPDSSRPLGIPLYASIEAGLIMLIIAHKTLKIDVGVTKGLVDAYMNTFSEWEEVLKSDASNLLDKINSEMAYISGYPHRGAMEVAGPKEHPRLFNCLTDSRTLIYVIIDGGVDKPFSVVGLDIEDYDINKLASVDKFPFPWGLGLNPVCFRGESQVFPAADAAAYGRASVMINELNSRRGALLENAEQLRKLKLVIESLAAAQTRLPKLVGDV